MLFNSLADAGKPSSYLKDMQEQLTVSKLCPDFPAFQPVACATLPRMAENEQTTSMEFSWDNVEKEELITPRVSAIAVYRNGDGDIVIRQEAQYYQEEDEVVLVPIAHVEKLVLRLNELLEEANRA